jgi:hypothetical protein
VDGSFEHAVSVDAVDVDGDGDLDVLGASDAANALAWWENMDGTGGSWTPHLVREDFDLAMSFRSADLDNDGLVDVVGAGQRGIWSAENRGGQFSLETLDVTPPSIAAGQMEALTLITMTHRGRPWDTAAELATLVMRFQKEGWEPMTTAEIGAIIEKLYVYLDDGSRSWEIGSDTLAATVNALSLDNGFQTVTFDDGDSRLQVAHGAPHAYFVVVELTADAPLETLNTFRVTHHPWSSSAEDSAHDIRLQQESSATDDGRLTTAVYRFYLPLVRRNHRSVHR